MLRIGLFVYLSLFIHSCFAGGIQGVIRSSEGELLSFANVYVKGTTKGSLANADGKYSIQLDPGEYRIVFRYVGFKTLEKDVTISGSFLELNVSLQKEEVMLKQMTIVAGVEDPAYKVIREAIKKRSYYKNQVKAYSCDVYIKGVQRLLDMPDHILGFSTKNMEINGRAGNDSALHGILYLSESVSKFSYEHPGKTKEVMISSRVSGKNNAFSYNQASDMLIDFYDNLLKVSISQRGFVSPIAYNAMFYYRYKLLGAYLEDGYLINKIQVIPKRKHDPCFRGVIYIVEKEWRIHSTELMLTPETQIDFVDTFRVQQVFAPVNKDVWMPISNRFDFSFGMLGIKGNGYYLGVNTNYDLQPSFDKKTFKGEEWKVLEDANKKDSAYWESVRPVELTIEEVKDYKVKDSIQVVHESKEYLDSIDRKFNKFRPFSFITNGYSFRNRYMKENWRIAGLIPSLQFNTVEGTVINMNFSYNKELERKRRLFISPTVRYGFVNGHLNSKLLVFKTFKNEKFQSAYLNGGSDVQQFNAQQPITPFLNTFYTLLNERNYMKVYEKIFTRAGYRQELVNGLYLRTEVEWAHRYSLSNSSNFRLVDDVVQNYTSNDPQDTSNRGPSFKAHEALTWTAILTIRFKQKYYSRPHEKIITGTSYPALTLAYKKGLMNVLGSDVNFDMIRIGAKDDINFGLWGSLSYEVTAGTFLNASRMYFMDWYHFNGNRTFALRMRNDAGDVGDEPGRIAGFNLLDYYSFSSAGDFLEAHAEHHFNGFILNKLPLLRKLRFQEVAGVHYLLWNGKVSYTELALGIEHIGLGSLMPGFIRVDYITSVSNVRYAVRNGIRIGFGF